MLLDFIFKCGAGITDCYRRRDSRLLRKLCIVEKLATQMKSEKLKQDHLEHNLQPGQDAHTLTMCDVAGEINSSRD